MRKKEILSILLVFVLSFSVLMVPTNKVKAYVPTCDYYADGIHRMAADGYYIVRDASTGKQITTLTNGSKCACGERLVTEGSLFSYPAQVIGYYTNDLTLVQTFNGTKQFTTHSSNISYTSKTYITGYTPLH